MTLEVVEHPALYRGEVIAKPWPVPGMAKRWRVLVHGPDNGLPEGQRFTAYLRKSTSGETRVVTGVGETPEAAIVDAAEQAVEFGYARTVPTLAEVAA